jgi:RHH-type transcriptional regulator, rel operon repressor / antitoxin RelB
MPESSVLTLRLDSRLKKQLERLSKAMNRTRSFVASEAIREYVELNEWQIEQVKQALVEADSGDFASDANVARVVKKWTRRAR